MARRVLVGLVMSRLLSFLLVFAAAWPARAFDGDNGKWVNGKWVNGKWVNGKWVNGPLMNGTILNGRWVNGTQLLGLAVSEGQLVARDEHGALRGGQDLAGATLVATVLHADGTPMRELDGSPSVVELHVAGAAPAADVDDGHGHIVDNRDVYAYEILVQTWAVQCSEAGCDWVEEWVNACGAPDARAIPLAGRWDYREKVRTGGARVSDDGITLACTTGALAKCALMGYKPWQTRWEQRWVFGWTLECEEPYGCYYSPSWTVEWVQTDRRDEHQACTRMLRADYCGDGRSLTYDGTDIEVVDAYSPQTSYDTRPYWGSLEAVWGAGGATCLRQDRWSSLNQESPHGCVCPEWGDELGWGGSCNTQGPDIPFTDCSPGAGELWNKNGYQPQTQWGFPW